MEIDSSLLTEIQDSVSRALREDIGAGDVTSSLISDSMSFDATIVAREPATMAGGPWVDEVCRQLDPSIKVDWQAGDGDTIAANEVICSLHGPARSILTAERSALNFLQLLSATATLTAKYVRAVAGTRCQILDTRKTIPGLRLAQKYAVRCGGGVNHRIGLFDAILIKENHIASAGGIRAALEAARQTHPGTPIEIEIESIPQLRDALTAKAELLLLDNFSAALVEKAVAINAAEGDPPAKLEASGGITLADVPAIAATGVDYISVGALTKNVRAIDFTMRFG